MSKSFLMAVFAAALLAGSASAQTAPATAPAKPGLTLTTRAFEDGGIIPDRYSQKGAQPVSPDLSWSNVPDGVQSFVLIFHDPDVAPNRSSADNLHWLMFDIPGEVRSLPENVPLVEKPADGGVQGLNVGKVVGYRGPGAAAVGPYHHYTLELYALDKTLGLPPSATRAEVLAAMDGHVVAKAALFGRFHR